MNRTIAVIDDDVYIGDMIERVLKKEGYLVLRAYSGTEALLLLDQKRPDLILLDLMLPGLSGEVILPKISDIPVIVISAKVDVQDKVKLLLNGASDYLTKPFEIQELLARITVQFRNKKKEIKTTSLVIGDLKLDMALHELYVGQILVRLTKTEYAILKLLMQNPKQVITKSAMLEQISEDTPDCVESSLKVHISNLRKKLREVNGKDYIEAVWGIGFKLRE
ncbi:MAG TPA: response regulator transcription factor [Candidatus Fimimorpha faecalis]|uniref:Stage 0 sporulation protein A homolog n=1 Tax=Candidatus Fimimorpha faecalis TaxID=2840824 RepID=A0A9D1ECW5_9FIRM|nr:response regulator transcription factor [Candidatus Fimimorpha faecalis]